MSSDEKEIRVGGYKMATEQEVYNIGKKGSPEANRCCTARRARELGCRVLNNRQDNQLLDLGDVEPDAIIIYFEVGVSTHAVGTARKVVRVETSRAVPTNVTCSLRVYVNGQPTTISGLIVPKGSTTSEYEVVSGTTASSSVNGTVISKNPSSYPGYVFYSR